MSQKVLLIIIGIFFMVGLGFLVYFFFQPTENAPIIDSQNEPTNPFGNFFPTENAPVSPTNNTPANETPDTIQYSATIQKLRKISEVPVAGGFVFEEKSTTTPNSPTNTLFRYVERATGHIYEVSSTSTVASRISNTTIPAVYEAFFLENKDRVAFRYLDRDNKIDTYVATIRATTTNSGELATNLEGVFMQKGISTFSVSPNLKNIFILSPNTNQTSQDILLGQASSALNPNRQTNIFGSPISAWTGEWFGIETIAINSKPSYLAQGVLYFINARTGAENKILGPIFGLMSKVSPNGRKVIYSKNDNNEIITNLYNVSDNVYKNVPIKTLADKCVWSKDNINVYCAVPASSLVGNYPDIWYMGQTSFNDSIVKIDTELELVDTIMNANSLTSESLDIINMQLSPKEDFLMFINKRDLSLWSLDIKQE